MTTSNTTHPMILVAAASVTAVSLAGVAYLAGWMPTSKAPAEQPALVAAAPATAQATPPVTAPVAAPVAAPVVAPVTPAPAAKAEPAPVPKKVVAPKPKVVHTTPDSSQGNDRFGSSTEVSQAPAAPPACKECGSVESIHEVSGPGEPSPLGAIAGGVIGGLLGNQVGQGNGKTAATVAGVIGGAFAGREVEKNVRTSKQYEVTVRFDDGATRTFTQTTVPNLRNGDRVKLQNGALSPL